MREDIWPKLDPMRTHSGAPLGRNIEVRVAYKRDRTLELGRSELLAESCSKPPASIGGLNLRNLRLRESITDL